MPNSLEVYGSGIPATIIDGFYSHRPFVRVFGHAPIVGQFEGEKRATIIFMAWTQWRLLANRKEWFSDQFDYDGPSCYELGTGGPRGGDIQPHYVGETKNERARMCQYASHGSHLSKTIDWHLKEGWCLYYRGTTLESKVDAVAMQNRMLAKFKYDWNDLLNRDDSD